MSPNTRTTPWFTPRKRGRGSADIPRPNAREMVLLALLKNGEKFSGELRTKYEKLARERMPAGSIYTTLERMVQKGFIESRAGDPSPTRGGNRRRYFRLTRQGRTALRRLEAALVTRSDKA